MHSEQYQHKRISEHLNCDETNIPLLQLKSTFSWKVRPSDFHDIIEWWKQNSYDKMNENCY